MAKIRDVESVIKQLPENIVFKFAQKQGVTYMIKYTEPYKQSQMLQKFGKDKDVTGKTYVNELGETVYGVFIKVK